MYYLSSWLFSVHTAVKDIQQFYLKIINKVTVSEGVTPATSACSKHCSVGKGNIVSYLPALCLALGVNCKHLTDSRTVKETEEKHENTSRSILFFSALQFVYAALELAVLKQPRAEKALMFEPLVRKKNTELPTCLWEGFHLLNY